MSKTQNRGSAAHPACAKPLDWNDPVTEVLTLVWSRIETCVGLKLSCYPARYKSLVRVERMKLGVFCSLKNQGNRLVTQQLPLTGSHPARQ